MFMPLSMYLSMSFNHVSIHCLIMIKWCKHNAYIHSILFSLWIFRHKYCPMWLKIPHKSWFLVNHGVRGGAPGGTWDLSSPTRDRTRVPCSRSAESYPLDRQGSPHKSWFSIFTVLSITCWPQIIWSFRKIMWY